MLILLSAPTTPISSQVSTDAYRTPKGDYLAGDTEAHVNITAQGCSDVIVLAEEINLQGHSKNAGSTNIQQL